MTLDKHGSHLISEARLLIVDDDAATCRMLEGFLSDACEIRFASCGREAIGMVREKRPDIVLLDIEMPDMSGYDVCREIVSDPEMADLPILFITAHSGTDCEIRGLDAGAVDFITKPLSQRIVRARIKTHLALKRRSDQLRANAFIDGLTGIANRRAFDSALQREFHRACRSGAPLALLMIDLDFFKLLNDHFGHLDGDDCLRRIAAVLEAAARRPGDLAARYGGDEFAIILPGCTLASAYKVAETVCEKIDELGIPHPLSTVSSQLTVTIGIGSFETEEPSPACPPGITCEQCPAELIREADAALYAAKKEGRNRIRSGQVSRVNFTGAEDGGQALPYRP